MAGLGGELGARRGRLGEAWRGAVRHGVAGYGMAGRARRGLARLGSARRGMAGKVCLLFMEYRNED